MKIKVNDNPIGESTTLVRIQRLTRMQLVNERTRWPIVDDSDRRALARVLDSGVLINGAEVHELEKEWSSFLGVPHTVAVSSCTQAIQLCLRAIGVGPGDEVIVPSFTFCGTVNPVVHCGATPVFTDVLPTTHEIDPVDAVRKRTEQTKAVIPVHVHGMPADVGALRHALPGLTVIEDACQAHGATLGGKFVGTLGELACFSLNQVKPLPAGQGGFVVGSNHDLVEKVRILASHGRNGIVGWSYGMTEFSAAFARSQLQRLNEFLRIARRNADAFSRQLHRFSSLLPVVPLGRDPVWHKYRLMLPDFVDREVFTSRLVERGVPSEIWPGPIVPDLPEYQLEYAGGCFPVARRLAERSLVIGNERYPLAAQDLQVVESWASIVETLLEEGCE